ncbi:MAG: hypothetical protein AAGA17_08680 [Actinomycetota bacterium]
MTVGTVLARATERVDEPVELLVAIAGLLGLLGLLLGALTVLYVRATRPRARSGDPASSPGSPSPGPPPVGAPVSDAGMSPAPPSRRRSPVLRTRIAPWRR